VILNGVCRKLGSLHGIGNNVSGIAEQPLLVRSEHAPQIIGVLVEILFE
jgi:hypothetical protein